MRIITRKSGERQARTAAHDRVARSDVIAKWLRAAVFALMGVALLYGSWWSFVQAAAVDVQFTAAAAFADCFRHEPPQAPASPA